MGDPVINKPYSYKPPAHLNKKVLFFGFNGTQLLLSIMGVTITFLIKWWLSIALGGFIWIIISFINREHKKGNPSPIDSLLLRFTNDCKMDVPDFDLKSLDLANNNTSKNNDN